MGPVRVPRPQPDRRTRGPRRHLPRQRGRRPPVTTSPTGRAEPGSRQRIESIWKGSIATRSPNGSTALIGEPAPSALVDQVIARGQGNPFFTRELVAAHLAGETIPMVLSDLISAEIAGLDDHARHVLGAVAAIGRDIEPRAPRCGRSACHERRVGSRGADRDRRAVAGRRQATPTGSGTRCSARSSTPTCSRRNERACTAESPKRCSSSPPMRCAAPTGPVSWPSTSTAPATAEGAFLALLAAADAAETVAPGAAFGHLERAFELWDAVGERCRDGQPTRPAVAGRRARHLHRRQPTSSRARSRRVRAAVRRRWARRGATSGSAATCGPADSSRRAVSSSQQAADAADERRRRRGSRRCSPVSGKPS